jgi:hypothetical protein
LGGGWKGGFLLFYGRFLKGVLGKVLFSCGVFVVKLWRLDGDLWSVDAQSPAAKNMPRFENISVEICEMDACCRFGRRRTNVPTYSVDLIDRNQI